jgi:serine protease Do
MRLNRLVGPAAAVFCVGMFVSVAPAGAAPMDAAKAVETAIERAAEVVSPAVVNIRVEREVPEDLHALLEQYPNHPRVPFRSQGNGSGFLISSGGFILTSEHVVRDAAEIQVTLATRKRYPAEVVGADPRRDLAVIRIDAKGLPAAAFGDASTLRRGQFVLALGSPFGFGRDGQASLSFGIVSGTGRAIPGIGQELDRYYGNLIQTDAAVNPGNSGGPLVDLDGKVVGVNAVISSRTGASDGVGFAVPITSDTRAIIERLKAGEEIVYGFVGIEITEVGEEQAKASGAEAGNGAYVARVVPDAPGAKAGVREGDVVVGIGNETVRSPDDVIQIVQVTPVGEKVTLLVMRNGKRRRLTVEVARRPAPPDVLVSRYGTRWWRGVRVEPLTDELREQIGLEKGDEGVFVREVRDGSAAADAGIMPGMVIDQVGETKIASVTEFSKAVGVVKGKCLVHVAGIGVKVIQVPGAKEPEKKDEPKKPDEKGGAKKKPTEKPKQKPGD